MSWKSCQNFLVLENHSVDSPWWNELITGLPNPVIQNGYVEVPEGPGLGIGNSGSPRLGGLPSVGIPNSGGAAIPSPSVRNTIAIPHHRCG